MPKSTATQAKTLLSWSSHHRSTTAVVVMDLSWTCGSNSVGAAAENKGNACQDNAFFHSVMHANTTATHACFLAQRCLSQPLDNDDALPAVEVDNQAFMPLAFNQLEGNLKEVVPPYSLRSCMTKLVPKWSEWLVGDCFGSALFCARELVR